MKNELEELMKNAFLSRIVRAGLAAAATVAVAALAAGAALGAFSADAGAPEPAGAAPASSDETIATTVTIRTPDTDGPLEMKLDGLKEGERRNFRTPSGKDVVVTRAGEGYTVKIGEKTLDLPLAGGKTCVEKKVVVITDGAPASAKSLLEKSRPASYEALDARTKESVEKVLQELLDTGGMPGGFRFVTAEADAPSGGENVEIRVIRKKAGTK